MGKPLRASSLRKGERASIGNFLYLLLIGFGVIWLFLGICVAFSPRILPKMMQWNYFLAWMILFALPVFVMLKFALRGIRSQRKRFGMKTVESVTKEYLHQSVDSAEKDNVQRKGDMTYIETVYTIEPKTGHVERFKGRFYKNSYEMAEELSTTYRCRHCNSIISQSEYESYGGLCHGCYIDFKRDIRRSGLLGADRASTW